GWIAAFHSIISKIGIPNRHPLQPIKSQSNQFDLRNNITNAIQNYLISKREKEISFERYDMDNSELAHYFSILKYIQTNQINEKLIDYAADDIQKNRLLEWIHLNQSIVLLREKITSTFNPKIIDFNYQEIQMVWNQSKHTWFLPKWLKQRKVKVILQGFSSNKITNAESIDQLFVDLDEFNVQQKNQKEEKFRTINQTFEKYKTTNNFDQKSIQNDLNTVDELVNLTTKLSKNSAINWVKQIIGNTDFRNDLSQIIKQVEIYQSHENSLFQFLNVIPTDEELGIISQH